MKAGLLALAAFAIAAPAMANTTQDPFVQESAMLRLDGLDLATQAGQRSLAIRMDAAARAVCGDRLENVHLSLAASARQCRAEVLADIRDQIETRMAANTAHEQFASNR
ncbi:hypothetical protein GCM10009127_12640 [Alteraurantiacibacter aestuarii]|uniref:UrcA family protein n=1 Tax=Alteraurantiacibacter aestuarii TaxID=650004 RepID=A0A844ZMS2_9SPHN|nr:UrcA family protein [Alteraurantiacibacter aestuarii]MXO88147.1 UrcA family protein [Alteraurantiacibacter aestuarii]